MIDWVVDRMNVGVFDRSSVQALPRHPSIHHHASFWEGITITIHVRPNPLNPSTPGVSLRRRVHPAPAARGLALLRRPRGVLLHGLPPGQGASVWLMILLSMVGGWWVGSNASVVDWCCSRWLVSLLRVGGSKDGRAGGLVGLSLSLCCVALRSGVGGWSGSYNTHTHNTKTQKQHQAERYVALRRPYTLNDLSMQVLA